MTSTDEAETPTPTTPFWNRFDKTSEGQYLSEDKMFAGVFLEVIREITYKDGYGLLLAKDKRDSQGRWYFQVECARPDVYTGKPGIGRGGKFYLSPAMNKSELVRGVFALFLAYETHECREFFAYRERNVFGPHQDVDALWEVADRMDFR
jgi:hypothetical protein